MFTVVAVPDIDGGVKRKRHGSRLAPYFAYALQDCDIVRFSEASTVLAVAISKDRPLDMFHTIGKFLYPKRS